MKKVCVKLVVIGIIFYSIPSVVACIHVGQHLHSKRNEVNDRAKRGSILVPEYKDDDSSDEARERTSAEVEDFIQKMLIKTRQNIQEPSNIFVRSDDLDSRNITQTPESSKTEDNEEDPESYIRMKAVTDPKEFIKQLIEVRRARKEKRNTDSDDPIAIMVGRKFNKPRKSRQKKYLCYCQEQDCQGKQCRNQGHKSDYPWKQKMYPNVKEYAYDEYENSVEETVGAYSNGYTNKIVSAPSTTTEPTRFTIPFANNVNFDQRVIVGGKNVLAKKPQKIAPFYQNPHVILPPSQPHPMYPYNTYIMQQPGIIYHGMPFRKNYPPVNKARVAVTKSDIPSPFGSNFPNINECIKLYGRTVCVISSSTKPPTTKVETIDLSDDKMYTDEEEPTQKLPVYPTQYTHQTSSAMTPKVIINEPPVGHRYYIDKNYSDGSRLKLPQYNIENKDLPYPNNQYNYQNVPQSAIQIPYDSKSQSANAQTVKQNEDNTVYLPNYSAAETVDNSNYNLNLSNNQNSIQQYSDENIPKYSVQTLRATTPKLIPKEKNQNQPYMYSGTQMQNIHLSNSGDNQGQSYSLVKDEYVPHYSSKEFANNRNYDSTVGNSNPIYTHPNNYKNMPQITPSPEVTTPVYSSAEQSKYYENVNPAATAFHPTIVNNAGVQTPHYVYTTDMHMKNDIYRMMSLYNSKENYESATSQPFKEDNHYTKNVADQKSTYSYSSGFENAPANSNYYTNINKNEPNYLTTSNVNEQYEAGNTNNNNQYDAVRKTYEYTNNNSASYQSQLPNLLNGQSNIQDNNDLKFNVDKSAYTETPQNLLPILPNSQPSNQQNEHLKFQVDKSAYNLGKNISSQNNYNNKSVISSQNVNTQVPSIRNAQQSIVIQPPELYKIENVNTTSDILGKPNTARKIDVPAKDGNNPEDILQPVTTLEDVETDEYKSHFKEEKTATLREANDLIQSQTEETKLNSENVGAKQNAHSKNTGKPKTVVKESLMKHDDQEKLFRGLEKVILHNDEMADLSQENYGEGSQKPIYGQAGGLATENSKKVKQSKNYATSLPTKSESTESLIQSVDDRPTVTYENTSEQNNQDSAVTAKNIELVQSAVKKVINNFVPGKAQDLLANYDEGSSSNLVGVSAQELLPEILSIPILKNLFSLPEIENMITDTAGNLLTRVTGFPIIGNIPHLIRNTLHNVIDQIPRPHPTVAPETIDENPTIEEHKFENGQWVTERVPLYETDPNVGASKEIFEKIESILSRSQLTEDKVAAHPIVQNLIVKAVKHALDKERGIVDESTIRHAFDTLIKAKAQNQSKFRPVTKAVLTEENHLIQPTATTPMDDEDYKLAPIIPVTEHVLRGGIWSESQKTLGKQQKEGEVFNEEKRKLLQDKLDQQQKSLTVSKSKNESVSYSSEEKSLSVYNEEKRKLLQEKLDEQRLSKTKSKNESVAYETKKLQKLDAANVKGKYDKTKMVGAKSSITNEELENETSENMELATENEDQSIERKPIKYYSPNDRILEYIKNHQSTDSPYLTTTAEIVGYTNDDNIETTTHQMNFRNTDPSLAKSKQQLDGDRKNENIKKPTSVVSSNANDQQSLFGNPPINQQINNNQVKLLVEPADTPIRSKQGTEATRQVNIDSRDPNYMGKLVPLDYKKTSQTEDLTNVQDSNLMYVGDGVRLPLTVRKALDGSFVLTLSDEVCKRFQHKECPCCLPSGNKGVIVRERRSEEETSEMSGDETSATSEEYNVNISRVRRGSEEYRTQPSVDPKESPEYTGEEEARVNKFITTMANMGQVSEENRSTTLLSALGELVSAQPTSVDFVTQSTDSDQTYQTETTRNQYENDRSKKDTTRATTLWNTNNDENYVPTTEVNHGVFGSFIDGLKRATTEDNRTGPPYRYQRYAEENFRTNVIKRVLYLMHNLAMSAQQSKS